MSSVRADDLAAVPLRGLMARNPHVGWSAVDDLICIGVGQGIAIMSNVSERGAPSHVCAAREIGRQVERRNDAGRDRIPDAHRPGDKIEPKDWMPEGYRKTLIRQIPARPFRDRRPVARRQLDHPRADAEAQGDPAGQGPGRGRPGLYLYSAAETLGVSRDELIGACIRARPSIQHLQLPDADVGRYGRDRLAGRWLRDHQPDPAVPLLLRPVARAMIRVCKEELPRAPGLRHHDDAGAKARLSRRRWRRMR